jgi:hypothetical protein
MKTSDLEMTALSEGIERVCNGLRTTYTFSGDTFPWEAVAEAWVKYATEEYQPSPAMTAVRSGPGGEG